MIGILLSGLRQLKAISSLPSRKQQLIPYASVQAWNCHSTNAAKAEMLLLHIGLVGNRDNISHWKCSYSSRPQVLVVKRRSKRSRERFIHQPWTIPDLDRNLPYGVALRLLKTSASLSAFWQVVAVKKYSFRSQLIGAAVAAQTLQAV
jgi:hypothetical protein